MVMVTFTLSQRIWELNHLPYVPSCQRCANYSIWCPNVSKAGANLSTSPAKRRINFSAVFQNNFSIILNIWEFQEYFRNSRKLISWNKEFKSWHFQNFIKENLLKSLTSFPMEHVGLTEQLFGWWEIELNIYLYLPIFICLV